MTIFAKVIADSVGPQGQRLTTLQLRYPKYVHGEFLTHRVFSRNSSSSRAIPVARMIEDVERDPVVPLHWGKNQPGMQADEELTGAELYKAKHVWSSALLHALKHAKEMAESGAHKQIVNRLLEPFAHINTLVTATEFENFFKLRCHPAAQPEMRALAEEIRDARDASIPRALAFGDWHLPYVGETDLHKVRGTGNVDATPVDGASLVDILIRLSVARCARLSYLTFEAKKPLLLDDIALYDRLVGSDPLHASPAEHQATPDVWYRAGAAWLRPEDHGNLVGFRQYRKMLERGAAP